MSGLQIAAYICLWASLAALLLTVAAACVRRKNKLFTFAFGLLIAVLLYQVCVTCGYPYSFDAEGGEPLGWAEHFARVVSNMMQYFSLDADYVQIVSLAEIIFGGGSFSARASVFVCRALGCAYTALAPVAGGALIFAVLSNLMPRLRLFMSLRRTKYVFSELNERSIETAESIAEIKQDLGIFRRSRRFAWAAICRAMLRVCGCGTEDANTDDDKKSGRFRAYFKEYVRAYDERKRKYAGLAGRRWIRSSAIVFTDVQKETDAELVDRAKTVGSICLKDDVLIRKLHWLHPSGKVVYFLLDSATESNLDAAVSLLSEKQALWKRTRIRRYCADGGKEKIFHKRNFFRTDNMEMFVFTQNEEAHAILTKTIERERLNEEKSISVDVINEYRSLVYRLIDGFPDPFGRREERAYPLYAGAVIQTGAERKLVLRDGTLNIVIVGGGIIAGEFFKTVYWCSQMEMDADGNTVPVRLSLTVISDNARDMQQRLKFEMPDAFACASSETEDEGTAADSHVTFRFVQATYGTNDFSEKFARSCLDADYALVALGDDDLNLQAATWVARTLDRHNLAAGQPRQIPVNFTIESVALCRTLVREWGAEQGGYHCVRNAFGSLEQRYHYNSIYMNSLKHRAEAIDRAYIRRSGGSMVRSTLYNYDSSAAQAVHFPYKMMYFGQSLSAERDAIKQYVADLVGLCPKIHDTTRSGQNNLDLLVRLEHRRWIFYMRANGYRVPTAAEFLQYAYQEGPDGTGCIKPGGERRGALRLHPCMLGVSGVTAESGACLEDLLKKLECSQEDLCNPQRRKTIIGDLRLDDAIIKARADNGDTPLAEWLESLFGFGADAIGNLSLLCTLYKPQEEDGTFAPVDYAKNDRDGMAAVLACELSRLICRIMEELPAGTRRRMAKLDSSGLRAQLAAGVAAYLEQIDFSWESLPEKCEIGTMADGKRHVAVCFERKGNRTKWPDRKNRIVFTGTNAAGKLTQVPDTHIAVLTVYRAGRAAEE